MSFTSCFSRSLHKAQHLHFKSQFFQVMCASPISVKTTGIEARPKKTWNPSLSKTENSGFESISAWIQAAHKFSFTFLLCCPNQDFVSMWDFLQTMFSPKASLPEFDDWFHVLFQEPWGPELEYHFLNFARCESFHCLLQERLDMSTHEFWWKTGSYWATLLCYYEL